MTTEKANATPELKNGQYTPEIEKRVYFESSGLDSSGSGQGQGAAAAVVKPSGTPRSLNKSASGLSYTTIRLDDCFNSTLTYIQPHIVGISRTDKRVYFRRYKYENELVLDSAAKLVEQSKDTGGLGSFRFQKAMTSGPGGFISNGDGSSANRNRMSQLNMNEKVRFGESGPGNPASTVVDSSLPGVDQQLVNLGRSATSSFPIKHARLVFYDSLLNKSSTQLLSARYRLANKLTNQAAPPELEDTIELVMPNGTQSSAPQHRYGLKKRNEASEPSRFKKSDLNKKLLRLSFNKTENNSNHGNQSVIESSGHFLNEIDNQLSKKKTSKDDIKLMLESMVASKQQPPSAPNGHMNRSSTQILMNDYIYLPEGDKESKAPLHKSESLKKSQKRINFKTQDHQVIQSHGNGPSLLLSGKNATSGSLNNLPENAIAPLAMNNESSPVVKSDPRQSQMKSSRSSKSVNLIQMPNSQSMPERNAELLHRSNTSTMFKYTKLLTAMPQNEANLNYRLNKRMAVNKPRKASVVSSNSKMIDISFPSYQNYPQEEQKFVC